LLRHMLGALSRNAGLLANGGRGKRDEPSLAAVGSEGHRERERAPPLSSPARGGKGKKGGRVRPFRQVPEKGERDCSDCEFLGRGREESIGRGRVEREGIPYALHINEGGGRQHSFFANEERGGKKAY